MLRGCTAGVGTLLALRRGAAGAHKVYFLTMSQDVVRPVQSFAKSQPLLLQDLRVHSIACTQ